MNKYYISNGSGAFKTTSLFYSTCLDFSLLNSKGFTFDNLKNTWDFNHETKAIIDTIITESNKKLLFLKSFMVKPNETEGECSDDSEDTSFPTPTTPVNIKTDSNPILEIKKSISTIKYELSRIEGLV